MPAWKPLFLEVSSDGDVALNGVTLPSVSATRGYQHIVLRVHRLVAEAFHGPQPSDKHIVNHKDRNTRNNSSDNLEWITQKENCLHYRRFIPRVLSAQQVEEIRRLRPSTDCESLTDLAKKYKVAYSTIQAVRYGRTFAPGTKASNRAILSPEQIQEIRKWKRRKPTAAELGSKYKVSKTVILSIWNDTYV